MPGKLPLPKRMQTMAELQHAALLDNADDYKVSNFHGGQRLSFIPFDRIHSFRGHPFRLYEGERLEDMVESIRKNGILMPLIVRTLPDAPSDYELLSGHNRLNAGSLARLEGAWCLVKENLSDQDARMYVIETNLMQRSFRDMLPSEKAAVLTLRYSEMFSQGKRRDILHELYLLEHPGETPTATCGSDFHKSKSRDSLGQEYSLTGRSVANYLRVDKLSDDLKCKLDSGKLTLTVGVELSYLGPDSQHVVALALEQYGKRLSEKQAVLLRTAGTDAPLMESAVLQVLHDGCVGRKPTIRLRPKTYASYFAKDTPAEEIERVIEKALQLYFSQDSKNSA